MAYLEASATCRPVESSATRSYRDRGLREAAATLLHAPPLAMKWGEENVGWFGPKPPRRSIPWTAVATPVNQDQYASPLPGARE